MPFVASQYPYADRSEDRAGDPRGSKPHVLRRSTLRWLSIACLLLIAYGTLGPLGFRSGTWIEPTAAWSWLPASVACDRNDVFTNLLVYIPVGIAFRLLVRRRGRPGLFDLTLGLAFSVVLSYATEVLQQFMPARSSNLNDVYVNGAGALLGGLLAPWVQNQIRRVHGALVHTWHERSWSFLAWAWIAITAGLMTVPWDLTSPVMEVMFWRKLDMADVKRFGAFVTLGFCITAALVQRSGQRRDVLREAFARVTLLAMVFELAQLPIASHNCGLLDIFIATIGGVAGCGGAWMFVNLGLIRAAKAKLDQEDEEFIERAVKLRRTLTTFALFATLTCVVVFGLNQREAIGTDTTYLGVQWAPFQAQFLQPFHKVVVRVAEALILYAFLATLCMALTSGRGRAAALLLLVGLTCSIEIFRMLVVGNYADVTPPLLAVTAWFMVTRMWRAIFPDLLAPAVARHPA